MLITRRSMFTGVSRTIDVPVTDEEWDEAFGGGEKELDEDEPAF